MQSLEEGFDQRVPPDPRLIRNHQRSQAAIGGEGRFELREAAAIDVERKDSVAVTNEARVQARSHDLATAAAPLDPVATKREQCTQGPRAQRFQEMPHLPSVRLNPGKSELTDPRTSLRCAILWRALELLTPPGVRVSQQGRVDANAH